MIWLLINWLVNNGKSSPFGVIWDQTRRIWPGDPFVYWTRILARSESCLAGLDLVPMGLTTLFSYEEAKAGEVRSALATPYQRYQRFAALATGYFVRAIVNSAPTATQRIRCWRTCHHSSIEMLVVGTSPHARYIAIEQCGTSSSEVHSRCESKLWCCRRHADLFATSLTILVVVRTILSQHTFRLCIISGKDTIVAELKTQVKPSQRRIRKSNHGESTKQIHFEVAGSLSILLWSLCLVQRGTLYIH